MRWIRNPSTHLVALLLVLAFTVAPTSDGRRHARNHHPRRERPPGEVPPGTLCAWENGAFFVRCTLSTQASSVDLVDLLRQVPELIGELELTSTMVIQAWGGTGINGGGKPGFAQHATTIADYSSRYGTTTLHYYLGADASPIGWPYGNTPRDPEVYATFSGGGAATIVAAADLTATPMRDENVLLVAGGGGGATHNPIANLSYVGGDGGGVVATQFEEPDCGGDRFAHTGFCKPGTPGSNGGLSALPAQPGNAGLGGAPGDTTSDTVARGAHGGDLFGGLGGRPGFAAGLAGGVAEPTLWYNLPEGIVLLSSGGSGGQGADIDDAALFGGDKIPGGGGGGGYGGGAGGSSIQAKPGLDVTGYSGAGGGSYALRSTSSDKTVPTGIPSRPITSNGGAVVITFFIDADIGPCLVEDPLVLCNPFSDKRSRLDIAELLAAYRNHIDEDTPFILQAWGAQGGTGQALDIPFQPSPFIVGGPGGMAQMQTTAADLPAGGDSSLYYYLGKAGGSDTSSSNRNTGGAATLVGTRNLAEVYDPDLDPEQMGILLIAGGGGGSPSFDLSLGLELNKNQTYPVPRGGAGGVAFSDSMGSVCGRGQGGVNGHRPGGGGFCGMGGAGGGGNAPGDPGFDGVGGAGSPLHSFVSPNLWTNSAAIATAIGSNGQGGSIGVAMSGATLGGAGGGGYGGGGGTGGGTSIDPTNLTNQQGGGGGGGSFAAISTASTPVAQDIVVPAPDVDRTNGQVLLTFFVGGEPTEVIVTGGQQEVSVTVAGRTVNTEATITEGDINGIAVKDDVAAMKAGTGTYVATGVIDGTPFVSTVTLSSVSIAPTTNCPSGCSCVGGSNYGLTGLMSVEAGPLGTVTGTVNVAGPYDPIARSFDFCGDVTNWNNSALNFARFSTLTMQLADSVASPPPPPEPDALDVCPALRNTVVALRRAGYYRLARFFRANLCVARGGPDAGGIR